MVEWLSDDEQSTWRAFLAARQRLDEALDRQLQRDAGMPHAYYGALVMLSEADGPLRMNDLAGLTLFSPSRLTHAVKRMEESGWVERHPCPTDRRGQLVSLTELGRQVLVQAAPGHVAEVRRLMFDHLSPRQQQQLRAACLAMLAGIEREGLDQP